MCAASPTGSTDASRAPTPPGPVDPADPVDPVSPASVADWRWQHAHAATDLDQIEQLFPGRFDLSATDREGLAAAIASYGMRATPYYLDLARRASPRDPVWALAVPSPRECEQRPEELTDPTGDETAANHPLPGVVRRYRDRALLLPTPICSVHCRHCFRKRLVGRAEYALDKAGLNAALDWIAGQDELREVILTGGDPLTLGDERLVSILRRLDALPQLVCLRIHTRMPVVNPFRITEALCGLLAGLRHPLLLVTHFNHAVEVTSRAREAVDQLRRAGIEVLNQSVLLAGINDEPKSHRELLLALLAARVRPYALHQADLVPGTSHLRVSIGRGRALMRALRGTVPGHAIPRWLLDVPGGHGKLPLDYPWTRDAGHGRLRVEAPDGSLHLYGGHAEEELP